jgi:hypothetical protein
VGATVGEGAGAGVFGVAGLERPAPGRGEALGHGRTSADDELALGAKRRVLTKMSESAATKIGCEADPLDLTLSSIRRISLCM